MSGARLTIKPTLTVAAADLDWLLSVTHAAGSTFAVTIVHEAHPIAKLTVKLEGRPNCAVVELDSHASVTDLRELFVRCPATRFVFVAELPPRHAVAGVIRAHGHAVLGRDEPPLVIAATVAALLAGRGTP